MLGLVNGAITLIVLIGFSVPIARGIVNNVNGVVAPLKNIAQENGDLTVRLSASSHDEIGDLVHWFNTFIEKLQIIIAKVCETTQPLKDQASRLNNFSQATLKSSA